MPCLGTKHSSNGYCKGLQELSNLGLESVHAYVPGSNVAMTLLTTQTEGGMRSFLVCYLSQCLMHVSQKRCPQVVCTALLITSIQTGQTKRSSAEGENS